MPTLILLAPFTTLIGTLKNVVTHLLTCHGSGVALDNSVQCYNIRTWTVTALWVLGNPLGGHRRRENF